jgi:hypothetical protein
VNECGSDARSNGGGSIGPRVCTEQSTVQPDHRRWIADLTRLHQRGQLLTSIAIAALSGACASATTLPSQPSAAVVRFDTARTDAAAVRRALDRLTDELRRRPGDPRAAADQLHALKPRYFTAREALFELALGNAAAIVERIEPPTARDTLVRVSLALTAGTDLVETFHALAAAVGEDHELRAVWNEPDPTHAIPAGAWDSAIETAGASTHHDLFGRALERLETWAERLRYWYGRGDADVRVIFPDGITSGLARARDARALLAARIGEEDLYADRAQIAALIDRSRTARARWATLGPVLRRELGADGSLVRGTVHARLQEVRQEFLALRDALYPLAFRHYPKLVRDDIPYPSVLRLRAAALSLVAAAALYDNAMAIERDVLSVPRVRALFNQGDVALGIRTGFWDDMEREFVRWEYRTLLERALSLLEQARPGDVALAIDDRIAVWAVTELASSEAVAEARRDRTFTPVALALRPYVRQLNILEGGLVGTARTQVSRVVGNTAGVLEFRQGKLFDQDRWRRFLHARLRPGDLLVEKTPFRLTDKLIPGHFGHVAMYVGTVDDLAALGLDAHPWVMRHLPHIREGATIIEALRTGTRISTIEEFLNVDDLAILRPKPSHVPADEMRRAIVLAFSHIGKRYDFDFDNNTWDAIVCSELAFQTYVNVRWHVGRTLGSYTIAPDDVAVAAGTGPERPFELIAFVHDGRVVHDVATSVEGEAIYARLLGGRYSRVLLP